ncbi:MAG: CorA family divalent cation transporter [bacterium]|nr:CorA family divalent cation transporter [bacterium]
MRYAIQETLVELAKGKKTKRQFVSVLTPEEWAAQRSTFDMGIDIEAEPAQAIDVQAEVNYDSITGIIRKPDRANLAEEGTKFAFALDETGIIFIDASGTAAKLVETIKNSKRWRKPSLERFLYDFLLLLISGDTAFMTGIERELDAMERTIHNDYSGKTDHERINEIRSDLRDLDDYLEHLQDFAEVLEENENGFFAEDNLRYFRLFYNRVEKLRDKAASLREQAMQMRDLSKMYLDIHQNRIMTVLTVVTALFAPLTLIVGWYGMNFQYMPELALPYSYPLLIVLCLTLTLGLIALFKRLKWL